MVSTSGDTLEADSRLFSTYAIGFKDKTVKDNTKKTDTKKTDTTKKTTTKASGKSPNTGNTLLGEESLEELYIQPSYYKSESEIGDVEQLLDEFISKGNHGVLWIVGEPGYGKTSMCIKAVADYRSWKRYQQARGVFWFRLNPQGTTGMVKPKTLVLEKVFSWGRITGNRSNMIEPSEIEGSLVFLDGFDHIIVALSDAY